MSQALRRMCCDLVTAWLIGTGACAGALAADMTPDPFSFPPIVGVPEFATVTSAPATITGIDVPTPVSISYLSGIGWGFGYSIGCTGTFTMLSGGLIENGQTVCVQHTQIVPRGFSITTRLTVGTVSADFVTTTYVPNLLPNPFSFASKTNVAPGSYVVSDPATITGLASSTIALATHGGEISVNCSGTWWPSATIANGEQLCVRVMAASTAETAVTTGVRVGEVFDPSTRTNRGYWTTFSASTGTTFDTTPDPFSFPARHHQRRGVAASGGVVIRGLNGPGPVTAVNGTHDIFRTSYGSQGPLSDALDGDLIVASHTTSATLGTTNTTTVTIGGVSGGFSSVTLRPRLLTESVFRDLNADDYGDFLFDFVDGDAWACLRHVDTSLGYVQYRFDCQGLMWNEPDWRITRTTDVNGDGQTDLIWHNAVTGQTAIWLMNGKSFDAGAIVVASADWAVTHVGDFDGDGHGDLLWLNAATGEKAVWLMAGVWPHRTGTLPAPADWRVELVADFNGDGKSDLVLRNAVTGATAVWIMDGTAMVGGAIVVTAPEWMAVLAADLDGDGRDDLVWRNDAGGLSAAWLMDGVAFPFVSGTLLPLVATRTPIATGDFDADGRADLVTRDGTSGELRIAQMSGLTITSDLKVSDPPEAFVRAFDWTGDGSTDLVTTTSDPLVCNAYRLEQRQVLKSSVVCNVWGDHVAGRWIP